MTCDSFPIYLPSKWEQNLKKTLRENPPDFKADLDYFKYIGQLVYYRLSRIDESILDKKDGYVPINKQSLQKRVNPYRKHLDYLVAFGFLEEEKIYEPGVQSGGLKYPENYMRQDVVKSKIRKKTLLKSLRQKKKNPQPKEAAPDGLSLAGFMEPDYLFKWLKDDRLTIDMKEALEILHDLKVQEGKIPEKKKLRQLRYNLRSIPAHRINEKDQDHIHIDDTAGRLHSNLTCLKKELRSTVRFDGEKLCSVDIVNSQPFFALGILVPEISKKHNMTQKILNYNSYLEMKILSDNSTNHTNYNTTNSNNNNTNSSIMLLDYITQLSDNEDVEKYTEWVTSGTFYESFAMELARTGHPEYLGENGRKLAKTSTFRVLFDRNTSLGFSFEMQAFKQILPSVYDLIKYIKSSSRIQSFHNAMACTMQNFEAEMILYHCCGTIAKERPDLPIFTIHDSIVTTAGNEEYVKATMQWVFQEQMGIVPQMKLEYW